MSKDLQEKDSEILIVVEGGVVQAVYSDLNVKVRLFDHDNLEETHTRQQRAWAEADAIGELTETLVEVAE